MIKKITSRQRLPASPHRPKVGDEVTFFCRDIDIELKGTVISYYGRIYVIKRDDRLYTRIFDEQYGLKEA
jgi:hypothetical protein